MMASNSLAAASCAVSLSWRLVTWAGNEAMLSLVGAGEPEGGGQLKPDHLGARLGPLQQQRSTHKGDPGAS
jgi:hypothetical protein